MSAACTNNFAIVCDSACDLPLSTLEAAGIAVVPLIVAIGTKEYRDIYDLNPSDFLVMLSNTKGSIRSYTADKSTYIATYQKLIDSGIKEIVALFSSSTIYDSYKTGLEAAKDVSGARIQVIDTKCASGQLAVVLAALYRDQKLGLSADEATAHAVELAHACRLLLIPANDAPARSETSLSGKRGLLAKADFLKAKALGTRHLYSLDATGKMKRESSSKEVSYLAGRCARLLSSYAQEVGSLVYIEIHAGAPRLLSLLEKPLDTNEFESVRAGIIHINPASTARLGVGTVGIAYAPATLISEKDLVALLQE